ncbi:rap guanine nucleotide exchange factor 5 isoform X3 [Salmo salar]|uniref:Rap guanine nucleotide exchange factor 5 isoform X3 n=1 Tax=Salmo salar TaxID=8030 RepID=A0ABM3E318_SALSA|nr:rap guanine nucleotide exchange factor 5 isoform X3 [Salmo salar]
MEDSESGGEDGMVGGSRWNNRNTGARDQTQLRQKIRDLPGLLKHGLHLRKKSQSPDTIPGPSTSPTVHKSCSQSFPCAGRAVRNAFLSHGPYPAKDKIHLARIIRRSYVGVELVQWLCEQCVYVRCRSMAVRVWQVLLELGILLSVDQRVVFGDSNSYYQFSFEECESAACEFCGLEKEAWPEAVRLLLQLVPYVQFRTGSEEDSEGNRDVCGDSFLQMKALERLTATVQNELAAALARKARKAMAEQGGQESPDSTPRQSPTTNEENTMGEAVGRVCLKERGRDVLVLQRVTSPNPASSPSSVTSPDPASSPSGGGAREEDGEKRYVVVSGTPLKILEHLLSDLRLDDQRGAPESRVSELLLDDFLLTYLVFMTTNDLCQALLGHYSSKRVHGQGQEDGKEALYRKRKVLHLVAHWTRLYKDFLREDEHIKAFMKTLSRCVLEDLYEFPSLEKDMKEFQKLLRRRHTVDECPPQQKSKPLFQQLSLKENSLPLRFPRADTKEVLCRVYVSADSYLCVYTHSLLSVAELLRIVGQKMDRPEEDMVLVTHTPTGERRMLQAGQYVYSETLTPQSKLMVCRRDLTHIMAPLTDSELSRRTVRLLGINTWDMAAVLTQLDWNLFNSIHEQELVYSTMSCSTGGSHREGLSVLLQRCNEVQQWVMSEVLMCVSLNKRVQLLKKFIKIAAHCKAQRNLNSAFAIIMGLNTAAVSRLNITWEKVPGKFKKIFSELELITDPSLNHKAYRDAFKKMKPPKIPFMPLLLKDITFIHEGNKTFQDNLVNFQKLHMIADTVRLIRHCQSDQLGNEVVGSDSAEVRASVHYLHIIDNQQTLFQLSHKLEPRA